MTSIHQAIQNLSPIDRSRLIDSAVNAALNAVQTLHLGDEKPESSMPTPQ